MLTLPDGYGTPEKQLISMSAGNYGKSFAYITNKMGLKGTIIMPETAPINRAELIQVHYCFYFQISEYIYAFNNMIDI